jgi:vancomycin resistance protein YoaR
VNKKYKNLYIGLIIFSQTALSICVGLLIFFLISQKSIAPAVYISDIYVGKMDKTEAGQKIEERFGKAIKNGSITIIYDKNKAYKIKYSDIEAYVNTDASIAKAKGKNTKAFANQFNGYFFNKRNDVYPVISYNEAKLKEKVRDLAKLMQKVPLNANIDLINGEVIKRPGIAGVKLNIENSLRKLSKEIPERIGTTIEFNNGKNLEIENISPQYSVSDFNGANEVISQYSTVIKDPEQEDSIKTAVHAINKVVLFPKDVKRGLEAGTFTFNKYLALDGALMEENIEGYNQVASTLNAAVLNSEIDSKVIIRNKHNSTVDYIDPGLDALVLGNTYNYKFKNTLDNIIIIFAQVKDNKVIVSLVGKKEDKKTSSSLEIDVVRYDPSIVNTESQTLKSGEKKMISPGKEGVKVNVYRTISSNGNTISKTLIYKDVMYDAVKAVVETGPGTGNN